MVRFNKAALARHASRFLVELAVVFIGVSAAFMVDNYRDQREQARSIDAAYSGLLEELSQYSSRGRAHAARARQVLAAYRAERTQGGRPPPAFYRLPGSEHPPEAVWQTSVASGVVNLIPPALRREMGWFYGENSGISDRYVRYAEFTESQILPGLKETHDVFHDPQTGELYPRFQVHMDLLDEYAGYLERQAKWADRLRHRIRMERHKL
jgi:hypothetical protein